MAQLVCITSSTNYHVVPDDNNGGQTMLNTSYTLHGLLNKFEFEPLGSNTEIQFLSGIYHLQKNFTIENVENIFLRGDSSTIKCVTSVGLAMVNVTRLTIANITFINCRRDCSQYLLINMSKQINYFLFKAVPMNWHTAVLLYYCKSVAFNNVSLFIEAGGYALVGINLRNVSKFYSIQVVITKSTSKLIQLTGVIFHYHNSSVTADSTIIIYNFQFMLEFMYNTCTPVALQIVVLKQLVKVNIIIQDTKFIDYYNTIALFYRGIARKLM